MLLIPDLKSAFALSGTFALAGASAFPLLLPTLPAEARSLPLSMPVFCILLAVQLFGGWREVPPISWLWLAGLNGLRGVSFRIVFLTRGIEAAIEAHLVTDAIWHAGSRLVLA